MHVHSDAKGGVIAEVPKGCRCVHIGGANFERSFRTLTENNLLLEGDEVAMLVFLLLHEVGHVANEHYGAFLPKLEAATPNLDQTASKAHEEEADAFVGQILRREFLRLGNGDDLTAEFDTYFGCSGFDDPDSVCFGLRDPESAEPGITDVGFLDVVFFTWSLSFVISAEMSLDCFGCRVLGHPSYFWDHGQSHPNFQYRLLKIAHAITESPASLELIKEFEKGRKEADANYGVIWHDDVESSSGSLFGLDLKFDLD